MREPAEPQRQRQDRPAAAAVAGQVEVVRRSCSSLAARSSQPHGACPMICSIQPTEGSNQVVRWPDSLGRKTAVAAAVVGLGPMTVGTGRPIVAGTTACSSFAG